MEPIYGNHLGIVINDQDPEHRSRLQIFIPYLSNTLYASWNQDGVVSDKDINFKTFQDGIFKDSIKQKLKNILPWAEAAVPSFGGGTSGPVNTSLGKAVVDMAKGFLATGSVAGAALMTGATAIANQRTDPSYCKKDPMDNSSSNNTSYKQIMQNALDAAKANGTLIVSQNIPDQKDKISADANGNPYSVTLEGEFTPDGRRIGNKITSFTYADKSSLDGMKIPYVAVSDPRFLGVPIAVSVNNNSPILGIGGDAGASPWTSNGNSNVEISIATLIGGGGSVIQNSNGLLLGTKDTYTVTLVPITDGSIPILKSGQATQADVNAIYGGQLTDSQNNILDAMVQNAKNNEGKTITAGNSSSGSKPVQRQFAATTIPPSTNAKGFYSKPAVGAKVWVFFYGGDIQRPVYFATAMEANGSVVAYQPITT